MAGKQFPLSLVVKAVDQSSGVLDRITGKLERLNAPLGRLAASTSRFGRRFGAFAEESGLTKIGGALGGVGKAFGNVGKEAWALTQKLALMGAAATFAFYHFIRGGVDAGDVLAKTSDRLGLAVDTFAQFQFVAGRAGINTEELTTSFDQFNKRLGAFKLGSGPLVEVMKHLPAVWKKNLEGTKSNEEALDLMINAMARIKDPALRAKFATEVFGKSGAKMTALVQNGVGEIAELRAEFLRMNGSQEAFARSAEVLNDAMEDVEVAFGGVKVAIMSELFPALIELAGVVKEFLVANRKGIGEWARETAKSISDWVRGGGITRLADSFRAFWKVVSPIAERLGGWPVVLAGIAAAITAGPLLGALAGLGSAFLTLGAAMLTTPFGWFALGLAALAAGAVLLWKNWEPVKAGFAEFFPNLTKQIEGTVEGVRALIVLFEKLAEWKRAWDSGGASWEQGYQKKLKTTPDEQLGPIDRMLKWATRNNPTGANAGPGKPSLGAGATTTQNAHVLVEVAGPPGTRARVAKDSTADVDTALGITNP